MTHTAFARLFISMVFVLVACTPEETIPANSSRSTPVDDLPISVGSPPVAAQEITPVPDTLIQEADAEYLLLTNLYERSAPAVVNVEADTLDPETGQQGVIRGSGFIYNMQGHIITNAHVIKDATAIRVTFQDGYLTQATRVGYDTFSDLGVVQVNVGLDRLTPLPLIQDSDTVRVGQRAVAIGNPFGLSSSMSAGIVSGLGRTLRSAELIDEAAPAGFQNPSIIQTDTPINPGNSGGPLLNSRGEVIGVNVAIRTENGLFQGVGFAVPANTVRRVVPALIEEGRVQYAWLGLTVTPEENGFGVAGLAEALDLPVEAGVLVRGITVGSPADQAGLRGGTQIVTVRGEPICTGGDIVVAVNGTYINNMDELLTYLVVNTAPEDTITLRVVRDRETFDVPLTLRARPETEGTIRDCEG